MFMTPPSPSTAVALPPRLVAEVLESGGLPAWLKLRGWSDAPEDSPAMRLISHTLTFPLTLACFAHRLSLVESPRVAVVIAGARAEATLPAAWWREALLALGPRVRALDLHFVGPELRPAPEKATDFALGTAAGGGHRTATLRTSAHAGTLCEFMASRAAVEGLGSGGGGGEVGALVWLSNPGLGHPAVQDSWRPSLERLLRRPGWGSGSGGEGGRPLPVLVTSHSQTDQQRDLVAVATAGAVAGGAPAAAANSAASSAAGSAAQPPLDFLLPPERGLFRSRRWVADPVEGGVVAANWGAFAVQTCSCDGTRPLAPC